MGAQAPTTGNLSRSFERKENSWDARIGQLSALIDEAIEEEQRAHARVLKRNLEHLVEILDLDYVMPFVGSDVISGREWRKNQCLGTATWDHAADDIRRHGWLAL